METRELVLYNRDGKRMPATLQLPDGDAKGTVIVLHGIGGWRNQLLLTKVAEYLQGQGYIVFRFDESDGVAAPDADFFHNTTSHYMRDLEDVIAHLKKKSGFKEPFVLVGHSMGGLLATWYASLHPREVKRLILLAPAISLTSMWWMQLPWALMYIVRGHWRLLGIDKKRFLLGPNWLRDFGKLNGYKFAKNISVPTLIISAEKDYTVAKAHEHRAYARRFLHAEHSTISWADHDFDGHEDEVVATIRQWLTSS